MTAASTPNNLDPLAELDDLLAEAVVASAQAKAVKAAKDKTRRGESLSADDLDRLRAWEAAHEWKAVANVALFNQFQCICGSFNNVFEGLFRKEQHRHLRDSLRYEKVQSSLADLPNETAFQITVHQICEICAESKGWRLDQPAVVWGEPGQELMELPPEPAFEEKEPELPPKVWSVWPDLPPAPAKPRVPYWQTPFTAEPGFPLTAEEIHALTNHYQPEQPALPAEGESL